MVLLKLNCLKILWDKCKYRKQVYFECSVCICLKSSFESFYLTFLLITYKYIHISEKQPPLNIFSSSFESVFKSTFFRIIIICITLIFILAKLLSLLQIWNQCVCKYETKYILQFEITNTEYKMGLTNSLKWCFANLVNSVFVSI